MKDPMSALEDRKKLINAKAIRSLRDEMDLQNVLDKPDWISVHSHHYSDLATGIWREVDAVAIRSWRGILGKRPVVIKVVILVESKRIAEKQLLLPAFNPLRQAIIYDWLGSQRRRDDRFAIYKQIGLEPKTASRVDYEVGGNVADIMPGAPNLLYPPKPAGWDTAGFVEAQNGDGKINEIESSVVWRARLALGSAAQAIAQQETEISSRELAMALQLARISQIGTRDQNFDLFDEILRRTKDLAFTVTVFHPMVVVDADLWGVSPTDEIPVQHARVHLTGVRGIPTTGSIS